MLRGNTHLHFTSLPKQTSIFAYVLAKEECCHTIIVRLGIRVIEPILISRLAIVGKKILCLTP